ncbi:MAG TPA: TraB/GumN family protein [Dissulfurispiraceae bacterium]|nr:TraB/GumN family protein [Dissulfurispiraceae bacterium]
MWKVSSQQATAYILGTIHMMKADAYPLDSRIEGAFKRADAYALEFNIDDIAKMNMDSMVSDVSYAGDDTIRSHISKETYDTLQKRLTEYGYPVELMVKFRPWFLAVLLETFEYQKLGLNPEYGIDKYFLRKAEGSKQIVELESFNLQMDLFRKMLDSEQALFLDYTLRGINDMGSEVDALMKVWTNGDKKQMEDMVFNPLNKDKRLTSIFEKLYFERNRGMASKIVEMLSGKGTYFIAVGAGHLVGKRGILELLAQRGYTVYQQ